MDKFEAIQAFTQVASSGGFSAAARDLQLSRSAVSKLVMQLEKHLGVQLLHRSTRRVGLTETGKAFYERCEAILADLQEAELAAAHAQSQPKGILRLNAPMSFGTQYLGTAVAAFMQQHPNLQVQLVLDDRFVDPIAEGYDLVVRIGASSQQASLITHPVAPVPRVLCAAPKYLDRHGTPQHPTELRDRSCLHYGYLATRNTWKLLGPDGEQTIPVQGLLCANNGEVLREAAIEGLGIVLLPVFMVRSALQSQQLKVILPDYRAIEIQASLVYPVNRHLSTKVVRFIEFFESRFNSDFWQTSLISLRNEIE